MYNLDQPQISGTLSSPKAIHIELREADRSSPGVLWSVWKLGWPRRKTAITSARAEGQ
jgi:hypothetical protein